MKRKGVLAIGSILCIIFLSLISACAPSESGESRISDTAPATLDEQQVKTVEKTSEYQNAPEQQSSPTNTRPPQQSTGLLGQRCEGTGSWKLDTFPIDPENIELLVPMGRVQDSHVTPTDHQYIIPKGTKSGSIVTDEPTKYQIKAPADGYIVNVELFKEPVEVKYRDQEYRNNYLVFFEHSCSFYTRLIHIDTLSDEVQSQFEFRNPNDQHPYAQTRIPVKKGQVIGTVGPHSVDFQIMDMEGKKKSFIVPEHMQKWTLYTYDTFDYLAEPLRSQLIEKSPRTVAPFGGEIDYDLDGSLIGNWRRVGREQNNPSYWEDELSIVYDHLDPSQIRVSLGNFDGWSKAYAVIGNMPKPETVTKESGFVKYELVTFDYYDASGQLWSGHDYRKGLTAKNSDELHGVVLFQLESDRVLKVETFPGKKASEVSGFTGKAEKFER